MPIVALPMPATPAHLSPAHPISGPAPKETFAELLLIAHGYRLAVATCAGVVHCAWCDTNRLPSRLWAPHVRGRRGASVAADQQVELAQARGVGEDVDRDDLLSRDREGEDNTWPSAGSPYGSSGSVDERRLCCLSTPREGGGHGRRAADLFRCAHLHGRGIGPEHGIGIEQREQRAEVAIARGREECVDDIPLAGEIGVGSRGCSSYPTARAAGELPCRGRGAPDDGGIWSKGTANRSCSTKETRSAGASVSSIRSSGGPTASARSASCSGSVPSAGLAIASGRWAPSGSSRRDVRARSMSRHTRATTVVSHPPRFSTPPMSERLSRSQASWAASSASLNEPSIR